MLPRLQIAIIRKALVASVVGLKEMKVCYIYDSSL